MVLKKEENLSPKRKKSTAFLIVTKEIFITQTVLQDRINLIFYGLEISILDSPTLKAFQRQYCVRDEN